MLQKRNLELGIEEGGELFCLAFPLVSIEDLKGHPPTNIHGIHSKERRDEYAVKSCGRGRRGGRSRRGLHTATAPEWVYSNGIKWLSRAGAIYTEQLGQYRRSKREGSDYHLAYEKI